MAWAAPPVLMLVVGVGVAPLPVSVVVRVVLGAGVVEPDCSEEEDEEEAVVWTEVVREPERVSVLVPDGVVTVTVVLPPSPAAMVKGLENWKSFRSGSMKNWRP